MREHARVRGAQGLRQIREMIFAVLVGEAPPARAEALQPERVRIHGVERPAREPRLVRLELSQQRVHHPSASNSARAAATRSAAELAVISAPSSSANPCCQTQA